jgi:hypothetical protein
MKTKKEKRTGIFSFAFIFILIWIFFIAGLNFVLAGESTSSVSVQYSNPFGSSYDSLMNGPLERASSTTSEDFYDVEFVIPPAGCEPYVVRSDLLEEQNVPVFCQLVPLKINPSIDIQTIESINVVQKEKNEFVAGVGFHPALAAIRSGSSMSNTPSSSNIGYVVVVLKRQEAEKNMPDFVNITLSASLRFKAEGGYGIGENEFYLPEISEEEFENNYLEYSFYDGLGYLRAENIDENSAVISLSSYDGKSGNFRKIFSEKIEKGKTSRDIYLSNSLGGKGVRVTLKDITIGQTKAKIRVNDNYLDVYKGGSFYNDKCTLIDITAMTAGTGKVRIKCKGISNIIELDKRLNKVELDVQGIEGNFAIGDKILSSDAENDYFLVYAGKSGDNFVVVAKVNKTKILTRTSTQLSSDIDGLTKYVGGKVKGWTSVETSISERIDSSLGNVEFIVIKQGTPNSNPDIAFNEFKISDSSISEDTRNYFKDALSSYDELKSLFGTEKSGEDSYSYGEWALWNAYKLADSLGQKTKSLEILSRIENDYPTSKYSTDRKIASQKIKEIGILSSSNEAVFYDSKNDLSLELMSINSPSSSQAGVDFSCVITTNSKVETRTAKGALSGDILCDNNDVSVSLSSFDEDKAHVLCKYKADDGWKEKTETISIGSQKDITECSKARIVISDIKVNKVAYIAVSPITKGRSKEANFSVFIGIEKRLFALNLTPEEANKKIEELNKKIAMYKNITKTLEDIIKIDKMACMATSAYVNIKNLFAGKSGEATARTEVMEKWNKLCENPKIREERKAVDFDDCIAKYSKDIDKDVNAMAKYMKQRNTELESAKNLQENYDNKLFSYNKMLQNEVGELGADKELGAVKVIDGSGQEVGEIGDEKISVVVKNINVGEGHITQAEFSQIKLNLNIIQSSEGEFSAQSKIEAKKELYGLLATIKGREDATKAEEANKNSGLPVSRAISGAKQQVYSYEGLHGSDIGSGKKVNINPNGVSIAVTNKIAIVGNYLFVIEGNEKEMMYASKVYTIQTASDGKRTLIAFSGNNENEILSQYVFQKESALRNECKNCNYVKVFDTEPYKGMPSLLPIDRERGWYVYTTQSLPGGFNIGDSSTSKNYLDSGQLNNFYLCNVGENGLIEEGSGDDALTCIKFDLQTNQPTNQINGLSETEARKLVSLASSSVKDAKRKLSSGNPTEITVNNMKLKVMTSSGNVGSKCTDFMSYSDCKLLFNVCDPVVCPNSRCDLGGRYKVDNVIQSGLIGSTLLCLPNFVAFKGGDVYVPVCLTGINAGLEGWVSILESYRDCINESVATGKTVGICDEIHSVYVCDFFWRQVGPYVNAMFKNLFLYIFAGTEKGRGGGEYAFAQDAWNNAEKSMNYFQTVYAKDSNLAFGVKDLTNSVVSQVCKVQTSATFPSNLDAMLEPESPVQFYANFEERPYTSATVPARSSYSVYYHIYAGNNGHYYQVYLKDAPETLGYASKDSSVVASGYVPAGGRIDEKKDFIDVAGFKQLCVRIDSKDECGFKSISTSFAVEYANSLAAKEQATQSVTSEKECISGSSSLGSLLTPNIQQGVEETINPELYNQGITRVCAAKNPGETTNPTRWKNVGKCDVETMRCWIDTQSVKNAIKGAGLENSTLSQIEKLNIKNLQEQDGYLIDKEAGNAIDNFKSAYESVVESIKKGSVLGKYDGRNGAYKDRTMNNLEEDFEALNKMFIMSSDKAKLVRVKADIYGRAAEKLKGLSESEVEEAEKIESLETQKIVEELSKPFKYTIDNKLNILQDNKETSFYIRRTSSSSLVYSTNSKTSLIPIMKVNDNAISPYEQDSMSKINLEDDLLVFNDLNGATIDLDKRTITLKSSP